MTSELAGRTALVTGASRGIGAAIAVRLAAAGASVTVLGTSGEPRPNRLPGIVTEVADRIEAAGGSALAVVADVRSLMTLGLAAEFTDQAIAANGQWPRTAIATEAIPHILGEDVARRRARSPQIMADAALAIVLQNPRSCTGKLLLDEEVLAAEGITDLSPYAVEDAALDDELEPSFFLPDAGP